jgi:hypothetical protein
MVEEVHSKFFQAIQNRQPYLPDLLRPCMIIDNPTVLSEVVSESGAQPTHKWSGNDH